MYTFFFFIVQSPCNITCSNRGCMNKTISTMHELHTEPASILPALTEILMYTSSCLDITDVRLWHSAVGEVTSAVPNTSHCLKWTVYYPRGFFPSHIYRINGIMYFGEPQHAKIFMWTKSLWITEPELLVGTGVLKCIFLRKKNRLHMSK